MEKSQKIRNSAIFCVAMATRLLGRPISLEQIKHNFPSDFEGNGLLLLSSVFKHVDVKAKITPKRLPELNQQLFPVVVQRNDGLFSLVSKIDKENKKILVQNVDDRRSAWCNIDEFEDEIGLEVLLLKQASAVGHQSNSFGFRWFFEESKKYWRVMRDCLLASLFVQIFALLSPLVFMIVIDKVLGNNSLSTLDVLVFALIVVSFFEIVLNGLRTYLLSHTANRIDLMLGVKLFRHLMSLPLSYFETRQVGDTIARMKELENVRQFITGSGLMLFLDLFFLVVFVAVMFLFSPFLASIVVGVLPVIFLVSFLITPLLRNKLEDKYVTNANNQSFLVETIAGMETIKAASAEPRIKEKWEVNLTEHVKNGFKSGHVANVINQSTTVINKVLSVLLLWFGAKEVLKGNLTVGQLIAFNMLSSRTIAPIIRLSQIWKEFQQVKISIARIGDIFSCPAEPGFSPDRVSLPSLQGNVKFEQVSFRYSLEGIETLRDVSFNVKAGEVVGIVGSTGSGKTTLGKLIQRLYVPERGRVLIDGHDIATADASWLRRQIGSVVQDSVLFNSSIRDNIALNAPDLDIEDVIKAAELAGAHPFIQQLPNGYDTVVGERGVLLSAGQRQRLAIARALATNPRMLILDEATSALDYESELMIQKNMKEICKNRTVFIIAHRLSTVRFADRIISIENGQIVENDTPENLLMSDGRYAALHRIQEGIYAI